MTISQASGVPVSVDYATSDGSATAPGDYSTTTGTLVVAAGATTGTIDIPVVGNTLHQLNRTFTLTLSNPTGVTLAQSVATGTIVDDDPAPVVSISNTSTPEGDSGLTAAQFTVSLDAADGSPTTVSYATTDGSAAAPGDYLAATGSVTIPAGSTSTSITVDVVGDTLYENDENFTVSLSNPTDATLGTATATGTIVNDDAPPVLSIADVSVQEHDTGTNAATFTVTSSSVERPPGNGGVRDRRRHRHRTRRLHVRDGYRDDPCRSDDRHVHRRGRRRHPVRERRDVHGRVVESRRRDDRRRATATGHHRQRRRRTHGVGGRHISARRRERNHDHRPSSRSR